MKNLFAYSFIAISINLTGCATSAPQNTAPCVRTYPDFKTASNWNAYNNIYRLNKAGRAHEADQLAEKLLANPDITPSGKSRITHSQYNIWEPLKNTKNMIRAKENLIKTGYLTDDGISSTREGISRLEAGLPFISGTAPLVRIPPIMPPQATRSGHCHVDFDVNQTGQPINVKTTSCSENLFAASSVASVQKWKFEPKAQKNKKTKITFRLADHCGNIHPEAEPS